MAVRGGKRPQPRSKARGCVLLLLAAAAAAALCVAVMMQWGAWGNLFNTRPALQQQAAKGERQLPCIPAPKRILTDPRCGDGSWQREYARLHTEILAGERKPRYAIAKGFMGLADNLVGAVSVFYFALLTGRAFQMTLVDSAAGVRYEWAFDQPNINWSFGGPTSRPEQTVEYNLDAWQFNEKGWREGEVIQGLWRGDLHRELQGDRETLAFRTNYGFASRLFQNPHTRRELLGMGLRAETALGCAMDFLVAVKPEVKELYVEEVKALTQPPGALKIVTQVRTNDGAFEQKGDVDLNSVAPFWDCAQQIENYWAVGNRTVRWLLVADNPALRVAAKGRYGDKLVSHLGKAALQHVNADIEEDQRRAALQGAVGELWLQTHADFHIISRYSGFGRFAAFWAMHAGAVYTIAGPDAEFIGRSCGPLDYDGMRELTAVHIVGVGHPGI